MLKLEFQNMSGAELRYELLQLLGMPCTVAQPNYGPANACCQEITEPLCPAIAHADSSATAVSENGDSFSESTPADADKKTRKRRTKAQIEADEAAALVQNAAPSVEAEAEPEVKEVEPEAEPLVEVKPPEIKDDTKLTEQILRIACVKAQDRLGVGEPVVEVLKQYNSTNVAGLKPEDWQAVYDLVSKLGVVEEKSSF